MQDLDVFDMEGLFFFYTLLRVLRQGISSSVSLAPTIVDSKIVAREFLDLADLFGAQTHYVYETVKIVVVGEYKHLMLKVF